MYPPRKSNNKQAVVLTTSKEMKGELLPAQQASSCFFCCYVIKLWLMQVRMMLKGTTYISAKKLMVDECFAGGCTQPRTGKTDQVAILPVSIYNFLTAASSIGKLADRIRRGFKMLVYMKFYSGLLNEKS
jgi:hypothetical protein